MSDAKFFFKPGEGAHIETKVTLRREKPAAICGTVTDGEDPAGNALVLLLDAENLRLIDRQFTDEDGQFFFGPLEGDRLYLVKIHKNDAAYSVREIEN